MQYHPLYGSESHGSYGGFGIKIEVAATSLPDLEATPIWNAAHDAAERIQASIMEAIIAADPKAQAHRRAERDQLVGLFPSPIYVEEIPNGYSSAWYSKHLPWFSIVTSVGRFTVGWRKRVINIDWAGTKGTKTAEELFAAEAVTKGERYIHAWGNEKAREYVAAIIASAKS